jgi:hypothetical protein
VDRARRDYRSCHVTAILSEAAVRPERETKHRIVSDKMSAGSAGALGALSAFPGRAAI